MLSTIERRSEIFRLTQSLGKVEVGELAEKLRVSLVTIRNDLTALSEKGLVVRSRGGAIASSQLARELSSGGAIARDMQARRRVVQEVNALIGEDVQSIFLDSGSTTEEVALFLAERTGMEIMTNGLNIASALGRAEETDLCLTGGRLCRQSMSLCGRLAEESLLSRHFDQLILQADAIDSRFGITAALESQARLKRAMCSVASEVIIVADSSRVGDRLPHVVCKITEVNFLVTDNGISDATQAALDEMGIKVRVVDS